MEPIFRKYIPDTAAFLLPAENTRPYADLPDAPFAAPETIPLAEELFDKPIPALPASLYRQFYENGNRVNYETPYFERRRRKRPRARAGFWICWWTTSGPSARKPHGSSPPT